MTLHQQMEQGKLNDLIKISLVFEGRLKAKGLVSDTEARVSLCGGAACIAWLNQSVENKKFL